MNKVFLIGNLTHDPEPSETKDGTALCRFRIAVSRGYGQDEADFIDCTAWRSTAENVARFCKKGNKVAVDGSLRINNYEKDGVKKQSASVQVMSVEFLSPKSTECEEKPKKPQLESFDDDDDIPF